MTVPLDLDLDLDQLKTELPLEMQGAERWLLWRSEANGGKKPKKKPYYTNGLARGATDTPDDARQLDSLEGAFHAFSQGYFTGIGFALGADGHGNYFQGIDFDNIENNPTLFPILESMPGGYIEKSPSGNGYHIIGYGRNFKALASNKSGIEAYSKGRYFTVTGESTDLSSDICDLSEVVETILKPRHSIADVNPEQENNVIEASPQTIIDLRSALNMLPFDDYGMWINCGLALKELGDIGRGLWIDRSQQSEKWNPKDAKKWNTFRNPQAHHQFIFQEAQKLGWINPESHVAQPKIDRDFNPVIDFDALENKKEESKDRESWFIQADDFSAQPAPIEWLIKGWIQRQATIMLHGPSGAGKTFCALDMALRIASGGVVSEWGGARVTPGSVVYLAGEGHHGLKGRIAAWKAHHGVKKLDMWLSPDGCDLNTIKGYSLVAENIQRLPSVPSLIIVDTLHRFLDGDENSPKDVKTMLDACGHLTRAFGASVVLIHHTGVGADAQGRPRGSSAWRGALDVEIGLTPPDHSDTIKITAIKVKDGEDGAEVGGELLPVQIPGWIDEDGEQVSSCVFGLCDPPSPPIKIDKSSKKLDEKKNLFEKAWFATGAELDVDGSPYVSRSGFIKYQENEGGLTARSAQNSASPTNTSKPIGFLIAEGMIGKYAAGWRVMDVMWMTTLLLMKEK